MDRLTNRTRTAIVGAAALSLTLSACAGGSTSNSSTDAGGSTKDASGTVNYWLWDSNQQPAYQACADAFHAANPKITVKISQFGWDDYWTKMTTGFVSGTAPDVFTDHLSKYPEFVAQKQLVPLDGYLAADGVKTDIYEKGLADLWVAQDSKRYALPKDWDTISLFYNKAMTKAAGITDEQMAALTWNPTDGGTYEKAIAHLTVDNNGKRGDEAGFDKNNVKTYGLGFAGSGAGNGQTEWSYLAGSTGWTHTDKNPWGSKYNFNDPKFQATISWWRSMITKGYMTKLAATVGASMGDGFGASKSAINSEGSWNIGTYKGYKGVDVGIAPTPVGPTGKRASMFNGLGDSVWVGSKVKAAAVKWVEYAASAACEDTVGGKGIVFPALDSGVQKATAAFKSKGVDVTPFTTQVKDGTTFLFPITDHAAEITAIMQPAMDAVMAFKAEPSSLTAANDQVNALFK